MKKTLITGCARSGTRYISEILCTLDYDVPHERDGKNGTASFFHITSPLKYDVIFHQVRHPLRAISSMHTLTTWSWYGAKEGPNIIKHLPIVKDKVILLQCAKYWYYWNKKCEYLSEFTYKVEDFRENNIELLTEWCSRLGLIDDKIDIMNNLIEVIKIMPRNLNSRIRNKDLTNTYKKYRQIETLDPILKEDEELGVKIKKYATELGYKL